MAFVYSNVVSISVGESTTSDTQTTTTTTLEPIYHVLENPLMCDSCLRIETSSYRRQQLPCPSPPPTVPLRDYCTQTGTRGPVYERVYGKESERERKELCIATDGYD